MFAIIKTGGKQYRVAKGDKIVVEKLAGDAKGKVSFAEVLMVGDGDKVTVLTGTVMEWKWTNPHVWIILSVDDGRGGKVTWAIEGRTPGQLVRAGWSKSTLKPGDTITVDFSPAKDGSLTGLLTRVRRPDGTVVGDPAPPPAQ